MTGPDPGIGVPQKKTQKTGTELIKVEVGIDRDPELPPEKETQGQGHDPVPAVSTNRDRLRCYMCNEYDHFALEIALMSCWMRSK